MHEFVVRVVDAQGRTLRRFLTVARSYGVAMRRGYEASAETVGARDVIVVEI